MSRSKADVDNFITSFRKKAKSEQEIQLRGFQFATLYWEAREYVLGIKWAQSYLAVKHNDDRAHKLLGNLYEGVKDYGKAIDCYKKSLELNDTQRELILRIASLGCTILPNYDVEKLRYWVERAERFYPTHINVHKIKENIFRRSGKLPDYEMYLRNKLAQIKGDCYLNCKLVKLLTEMKRLREAVDHILVTQDLESVADQPIWWESTVHTLEIYIKSIRQGEEKTAGEETIMEMHSHLLIALCKWIMLSLAMMDKPPHNAVVLLKGLDQCLLRANSLKMNSNWDYVLNEMSSQLYYLMGLHLCRMAAMASFRWSDIIALVTCCFVQSAHVKLPDMSGQSEYETRKWTLLSSARLSEVSHMLHAFQKQYGPDWLEKCHRTTANLQSQTQLFHVAFGQEADPNKSYFMSDADFVKDQVIILEDLVEVVLKYDQDAVLSQPHNLQLLVWLGLQWDIRKDGISPDLGTFIETSFDKLHFSSNNLKITSVDNLRLLDIEAFLYLLVKAAKAKNESMREDGRTDKNQPVILPVPLCQMLFTDEQDKWFKSVCALYSGNAKSEERAKMRLSIQKGLEAIRNADQFNIDTPLLIHLARTFRARMLEEKKENDVPGNEQFLACQRLSVHYWQAASEHLKLLASDKALCPPKHTFFVPSPDKIKKEDMTSLQEEAAVALAEYEFQQGRHQQALNLLKKVKGVTGLFTKALMCKQLCHMEVEGKDDSEITADMILAQGTYLDQCTYSLYSAMDAIQDDHNNSMHEEIQSLLDDVDVEKQQLVRKGFDNGNGENIDTSRRLANGTPARSSVGKASVSSRTSVDGRETLYSAGDMSSFQQGLSPDPSPRRLMAELRSMNVSQTRLMDENSQLRTLALSHSRLLEQNSEILSKHNEVMEQNKFLMQQIINLNKEMQELKLNVPPPAHLATPHVPPVSSRANESNTINTDNIVINASNCRIEKAEAPNLTTPQPVMYYPTHPTVFPPQLIPSFNLTGFPIPGMPGAEQPCMPSMMTSTPGQRYPGEDAYEPESDIYGMDPHSGIPPLKLREGQVFSTPSQVIGQPRTPEIGTPSDAVRNDEGFSGFSGLNTIHPKTFLQQGTPTGVSQVMATENLAPGIKPFNYQPKLNLQPVSSPVAPSLSTNEPAPEKSASDAPLLRQILIGSEDSAEQPPPQTFSSFPSLSSNSRFNIGGSDKLSERAAVSPNFTSGTRLQAKEAEQTPSTVASFSFSRKPDVSSNPAPASSSFQGFSFGDGNFTPVSSQPVSTSSNMFSSTLFSQPQSAFGSQPTASPVSGPFGQVASTGAFKGLNISAQKESTTTSPFAGFTFGTQKTPVAAAPQPRKPGQSPLLADQEAAAESQTTQTKDESDSDHDSDDDVIVVYERKPTPAQIAMALKLKLPPTFYLYEYKEPCPGCIGCHDIDIAELFNKENRFSTEDQKKNITKTREESAQPSQETPSTVPLLFGGSTASNVTFASISAETNSTPDFMKQKTSQNFSWSTAGTQLFSSPGGADTEYDPHYEPIVTLPEVTDIKTGEEDETCLWKERGKLYRFNKDLNQWKERGVGDIKFMQNKNTGRIRILMRREQVLKVCANHMITPDIELKTMQSSDRAWVWNALDFSEGEASREQLAIRFKKPEVASEFKNKFEECKQLVIEAEKTGSVKKVEEKKEETEVKSLAEKFKPKPGSWNCDTCLVSNTPGTVKCLACATPKPGAAPTTQATTSKPSQPQPAGSSGGFRFGGTISSPQTSGFTFGGSESDKPSQTSAFTFGQAFGGSQPQTTSGFSFGSSKPTGGFLFGSESTKVASSTQQNPSSSPAFATTTNDADKKDKTMSLSEMFKPKSGAWTCPTCLCQNSAEHKKCPACQTHQPGAQPEASSSFASSTTSSSFKFGNTSLEQLLRKSDSSEQVSSTAPTQAGATSPAPAKTFSFGQSGKSLPQFSFGGGDVSGAVSSPPASTGFTFGVKKPTSSGFTFGSNLNQNAAEEQALDLSSPKKTPDQGCKFSEMAKSFTFQFKMDPEEAANAPPKSPTKSPGIQRSPGLMKSPSLDKSGDDSYYKDDDYDGLHFEPVVHLDPVELTTGEENEDVMFCHRAKLYRFNKESNEWKERGMGDIKIMKHKETGLYRILMRREQVLKLCANHFIQPEMDMRPNSGSDRSWVWTAMDASDDGNVKPELLAVRFKTSDVAVGFKDAFENAKEAVIKIKGSIQDKPAEKEIDDKSKEVKNESTEEIKTDQVEKNPSEVKGDTKEEKDDEEEEDDDDEDVDDSEEEDDNEEEDNEEEDNEEEDAEEAEVKEEEEYKEEEEDDKVEEEKDDKVEEEENTKVEDDKDKNRTQVDIATTSTPTFSFGQSFAAAVRKTMNEGEKSEPSTASSPAKASVRSSDQGYYPEEERDDLQFEPVVTLKEIEVKTGEEEEEQLFCQRAKLYRWNRETTQWKERGVGEIKILKHKVLNRCRVVMRRDQVLKICANHIITPEMELKPNAGSDRSLVWNAMDASDMEPQLEQLAVRFKTPAITADFKSVFEKCQSS